jgi:orotidine-5'-phosphate decarboxylase
VLLTQRGVSSEDQVAGSPGRIHAKDRLILALDVPNDPNHPERLIEAEDAHQLVAELDGLIHFVKIGWPLYMAGGHRLIKEFLNKGKRVFLDLKFGDIAETVKRLILVAVDEGVSFITVNASFDAVRAAVSARGGSDLKILTVTMLTSWDETDLREMGYSVSAADFVSHKTRRAIEAGCDGVIASGQEAAAVRKMSPAGFLIVTPGIRSTGAANNDHKRAATPKAAILAGSDYLVVGRPIATARNPRQAAAAILEEMQSAFDSR